MPRLPLILSTVVLDVRRPDSPIAEAGKHDTLDRATAAFCAYFAA